jgi:2-polyprenyl-6-methoxyphenol hydroxylase-like FAD-dependent oxidoreductase
MIRQIGLSDFLQSFPHLKLKSFEFFSKHKLIVNLDLSELCPEAPFALWMPQPILLNALWDKAKAYPNFQILFGVTARDVIWEADKVVGVLAEQKGEALEIRASVTVGADGRSSMIRKTGLFEFEYEKYDFDIVWFTLHQPDHYENTVRAFFSSSYRYLILPKYPKQIQCGLIVSKGEFNRMRSQGIEVFRQELMDCHPSMHEFARELKDFSSFSVLQARVSFVENWAKNGCLLIGDAAHTCSPAGAIGVSVATGTAIVAADVLLEAFQKNDFSGNMLGKVQKLREKDVKKIQKLQAGFTTAVFLRYPQLQWLSALSVSLAAKTGIMKRFQREIFVMKEPLPINSKLRF